MYICINVYWYTSLYFILSNIKGILANMSIFYFCKMLLFFLFSVFSSFFFFRVFQCDPDGLWIHIICNPAVSGSLFCCLVLRGDGIVGVSYHSQLPKFSFQVPERKVINEELGLGWGYLYEGRNSGLLFITSPPWFSSFPTPRQCVHKSREKGVRK